LLFQVAAVTGWIVCPVLFYGMYVKHMNYSKNCPICDKSFDTLYSLKKYCSIKCYNANMKKPWQKKPLLDKICPICKNSFKTSYDVQRYCGRKCSDKKTISESNDTWLTKQNKRQPVKKPWNTKQF